MSAHLLKNRRKNERGFSLMELLIAMMIMAVLGTVGIMKVRENVQRARHTKASEEIRKISEALDQYYMKHGRYPDFGSVDAMVEGNSPLVKQNFLPTNMKGVDPFGNPYEGKSQKNSYEIKYIGVPENPDCPAITRTPGQVDVAGQSQEPGQPAAGAAAK